MQRVEQLVVKIESGEGTTAGCVLVVVRVEVEAETEGRNGGGWYEHRLLFSECGSASGGYVGTWVHLFNWR